MLILSRYTELNADQKLLLKQLKLDLPPAATTPAHQRLAVSQLQLSETFDSPY